MVFCARVLMEMALAEVRILITGCGGIGGFNFVRA